MSGGKEKFERDFELFLSDDDSRLAALYRKLPQAEPDARLDAAVQAMARRTVASAPPATRTPARTRWLPMLSAAAVVALAAGIAFQIGPQLWQRSARQPETQSAAVPAAPPPAAPQPGAAAAGALQESAAPAAMAPRDVPALPAEMKKVENAAPRPAPRAFPAPARTMQETVPQPPAEAKPAMPAPAMTAPVRAKQADTESAGAPAAALAAPATQDRNASLYPEHWLANIRQMLRDNRREEALRSLAEFRKRYPDYRLPDDLRDLR